MPRSRVLFACALLVAAIVALWSWRGGSDSTERARQAELASAPAAENAKPSQVELIGERVPVEPVPLEPTRIAADEEPTRAEAIAQPEPAAQSVLVHGRVLDELGEPIADALVCTLSSSEPPRDFALDPSSRPWLERVMQLKGHSARDGRFELELSGERGELVGVLVVSDAFHSIHVQALEPEDVEQSTSGEAAHALGEVVLASACVLIGRVVDGSGRAISDAHVRAVTPTAPSPQTRTLPDGSYRLEHVPIGPVSVEASKAGMRAGGATVQGSQAGATLAAADIVLGPSRSIAGIAVDAEGQPLSGLRLEAFPVGGGWPLHSSTDAAGRFRFELGKDAPHELRAEDHDVLPLDEPDDVLEPGVTDARVVLRPHARTRFTVLDALTHAPIEAFALCIAPPPNPHVFGGSPPLAHAPRWTSGSLCVLTAEPGKHWVHCEATGYESHEGPVMHEAGLAQQTLRLRRAAGLRGRASSGVNTLESSAAGATVRLDRQPMRRADTPAGITESDFWFISSHDYDLSEYAGRLRTATCAADGSFSFADLNSGTYRLRVEAADGANARIENLRIERGELVDLGDIVLSSASSIAGVVLAADGQRLAGLRVMLWGAEGHEQRLEADGRFHFPALAPGPYELAVPNRRHTCFEVPKARVELAQGQHREVRLDISAYRPAELCATVSDSAGAAPGLELRLSEGDGPGRARGVLGTTGASGGVCGDVPAGLKLRLTVATIQGLVLAHRDLDEVIPAGGSARAEIELQCGALTVEIDEGVELGAKPWYHVWVHREPSGAPGKLGMTPNSQIAWSSKGSERSFHLPRVPAGTWRLEAVSLLPEGGQGSPVLAAGAVTIESGRSAHCVLRPTR